MAIILAGKDICSPFSLRGYPVPSIFRGDCLRYSGTRLSFCAGRAGFQHGLRHHYVVIDDIALGLADVPRSMHRQAISVIQ